MDNDSLYSPQKKAFSEWNLIVLLDSNKKLSEINVKAPHVTYPWHVLDLPKEYITQDLRECFALEALSKGLVIESWIAVDKYKEADKDGEIAFLDWLSEMPDRPVQDGLSLKKRFHWNKRLSLWWLTGLSQRKLNKSKMYNAFRAYAVISDVIHEQGSYPNQVIFLGGSVVEQRFSAAACCLDNDIDGNPIFIQKYPADEPIISHAWIARQFLRFFYNIFVILKQTVKLKIQRMRAAVKDDTQVDVVLVSVNLSNFQPNSLGYFSNIYLPDLEEELAKHHSSSGWISFADAASRIPDSNEISRRVPRSLNEELAPRWRDVVSLILSGFKWIFQYSRLYAFSSTRPNFEWNGIDLGDVVQSELAAVCFGNGLRMCYLANCFEAAFKRLKPQAVVTTLPFNSHCMMAHVAAPLETIVVGIQPGMVNSNQFGFRYRANEIGTLPRKEADFYDYLPAPDFVAAFGERLRDFMSESGFPKERIIPVGSPRLDSTIRRCINQSDDGFSKNMVLRQEVRSKLGVSEDDNVVVLLGQWAEVAYEWLDMLAKALDQIPYSSLVVFKPHPLTISEAVNITERFTTGKHATHVRLETEDTSGLLLAADVAVTHSSSTGLEALLLGTPLALIESPHLPDSSDLFSSCGVAPVCHNVEELSRAIKYIIEKGTLGSDYERNRSDFLNYELYNIDGNSTSRFISLLLEGSAGI